MQIGYVRISKTDGSQNFDLQKDALIESGVLPSEIYEDKASGKKDSQEGLSACLKALRERDVMVVWKLDRLGRNLKHLASTVQDLAKCNIGFKVLSGQGANIDTTTSNGRLIFGIFASLAEFESELIRERTMAGLAAARARDRNGGRKFAITKSQLRLAQAAMASRDTKVSELCTEIGVTRSTLYRYVCPESKIRPHGQKLLNS